MGITYILVEGSDDVRFFSSYYSGKSVKIIAYKSMTNKEISSLINSIKKQYDSDYLFFADADGATVDAKINIISNKYPACEKSKIRIVQREIESWYLAGLNESACIKYRVKYIPHTDEISKEKFDSMIPKAHTHISFQLEILSQYDKEGAKGRNRSFRAFSSQ